MEESAIAWDSSPIVAVPVVALFISLVHGLLLSPQLFWAVAAGVAVAALLTVWLDHNRRQVPIVLCGVVIAVATFRLGAQICDTDRPSRSNRFAGTITVLRRH